MCGDAFEYVVLHHNVVICTFAMALVEKAKDPFLC